MMLGLSPQAALSVARRVAEEMETDVGAEIGYSVRFEERTSPRTRIVYLTGERSRHPARCPFDVTPSPGIAFMSSI